MAIFSKDKKKPATLEDLVCGSYEERETRRKELEKDLCIKAEAMKPAIMAEQPVRLDKFLEEHITDGENYGFRCERWGDYLALFIKRGPVPDGKSWGPTTNRRCSSLNIGETREIKLSEGRAPDL